MIGFVYIMSNESFNDGLIKIGYSERDPSHRKKELEETGVPLPFLVEYYALVEDPLTVEKNVHSSLSEYRKAANREFFTCDIKTAINTIRELGEIKHEYFASESIELAQHTQRKGTERILTNKYELPAIWLCEYCGYQNYAESEESHIQCVYCKRTNLNIPWNS